MYAFIILIKTLIVNINTNLKYVKKNHILIKIYKLYIEIRSSI